MNKCKAKKLIALIDVSEPILLTCDGAQDHTTNWHRSTLTDEFDDSKVEIKWKELPNG
jgi:hypothetical protein